jgi:hypothetical protein
MPPIARAAPARLSVLRPTATVCSNALSVAARDCAMLREISAIETASCSALAATEATLDEVSAAAAAAECASAVDSPIAPSISPKLVSISALRSESSFFWSVMSVANLTTLATRPLASRIGL